MPVLVKKPKVARAEREYVMTPEEEKAYWESFEDQKNNRLTSSAELRKKLVKQRLEEGRQELRDGKIIWLR